MSEKKAQKKTNTIVAQKSKPKVAQKKNNGGKKTMKLADVKVIKLTPEELSAKSAEELYKLLCTPNRLSRERSKEFLVERIRDEKLNSITPEAMMNWTYKAVQIAGIAIDSPGRTEETAKKKLARKEFDELDAQGKADLISEFTNKRRAADIILPALIKKGLPLSPRDVVYLTNGRVEIEGVSVEALRKKSVAIVEGITFA